MTVCTVIPTYNNARTVADIVRRTLAVCPDVVVVNDGSTDETLAALEPLNDKIQLVSYSRNRGKGHALRLGLDTARKSGFDYAVTIDSDGQHSPEEIPVLVAAAIGNDTLVKRNGEVVRCTIDDSLKDADTEVSGWVPHWATCRNADQMRKSAKPATKKRRPAAQAKKPQTIGQMNMFEMMR